MKYTKRELDLIGETVAIKTNLGELIGKVILIRRINDNWYLKLEGYDDWLEFPKDLPLDN